MKTKEFKATISSIEELLKNGATYKMAECPQYGVNLIQWNSINQEFKAGLNLNNCKFINTMDSFILGEICYCPISE